MKIILEKQKKTEIRSNEQSNSNDLNKNFSFDEAVIVANTQRSPEKSARSKCKSR